MPVYLAYNGPMPTTAAVPAVTTGTTIKTMQQISTPSTRQIQLLGWGFESDDPPGADAVIDLIQADTAATVTAYTSTGIVKDDPGETASLITLGISNSGFTSSSETAPVAVRVFDVKSLSSVSGESVLSYAREWLPFLGPKVAVSTFLRVRATTPTTAVDLRTWVRWLE